jgi:hypothetical protein
LTTAQKDHCHAQRIFKEVKPKIKRSKGNETSRGTHFKHPVVKKTWTPILNAVVALPYRLVA